MCLPRIFACFASPPSKTTIPMSCWVVSNVSIPSRVFGSLGIQVEFKPPTSVSRPFQGLPISPSFFWPSVNSFSICGMRIAIAVLPLSLPPQAMYRMYPQGLREDLRLGFCTIRPEQDLHLPRHARDLTDFTNRRRFHRVLSPSISLWERKHIKVDEGITYGIIICEDYMGMIIIYEDLYMGMEL